MYCLFRTTTPSQYEIFSVIVAWSYVLAFQDQTPSQSEIFFVIVAWWYVLAFQHHNTLPKWNIFCYCSLIVCIGISGPNTLPKWNIFWTCSSPLPAHVCIDQLTPSLLQLALSSLQLAPWNIINRAALWERYHLCFDHWRGNIYV